MKTNFFAFTCLHDKFYSCAGYIILDVLNYIYGVNLYLLLWNLDQVLHKNVKFVLYFLHILTDISCFP